MSIKDEIKKVRDNVYEIPGTHDKTLQTNTLTSLRKEPSNR